MIPDRFRPVLAEVEPLTERFAAAGHRLYLVGGTVRDLLLGDVDVDGLDFDFTTDARPAQIKAVLAGFADAIWTQGERFGTIGAKRGERIYEITTHRADSYQDDSRKPDVEFADAVEADLSRRDFTINALALELTASSPTLVDPHGGAVDLMTRTLRTPLAPEISFSDDPLRMLRAARFIARLDMKPDPALVAAVEAMHSRLEIVSAERIRDELDKLIVVDHPTAGLWFTIDTGLAGEFLPELPAMRLEQDPIHRHKDVLTHTLAVVENVRRPRDPGRAFDFRVTRLAALFHDVGKPRTRGYQQGKGVTFHHHDAVGARMTRKRMEALALLERGRRRGGRAGRTAPALPHVPDGLDGLGGAPLRARRRSVARRAERAHPLRLHDAQRAQGRPAVPADGRPGGAHRRPAVA